MNKKIYLRKKLAILLLLPPIIILFPGLVFLGYNFSPLVKLENNQRELFYAESLEKEIQYSYNNKKATLENEFLNKTLEVSEKCYSLPIYANFISSAVSSVCNTPDSYSDNMLIEDDFFEYGIEIFTEYPDNFEENITEYPYLEKLGAIKDILLESANNLSKISVVFVEGIVVSIEQTESFNNLKTKEWYTKVLELNKSVYVEENGYLVYAKPFYANFKLQGVTAVFIPIQDIIDQSTLEYFTQEALEISIFDDLDNTLVKIKNDKEITNSPVEYLSQLGDNELFIKGIFKIENTQNMTNVDSIDDSESELLLKLTELKKDIIVIFSALALAYIVYMIAASLIIKKMLSPLIEIKESLIELGSGAFHTQLDIKSNDELKEIEEAFNAAANNLIASFFNNNFEEKGDSDFETYSEREKNSKTEIETELETKPETELETEPKTEPKTESKTELEPDLKAKLESIFDTKLEMISDIPQSAKNS